MLLTCCVCVVRQNTRALGPPLPPFIPPSDDMEGSSSECSKGPSRRRLEGRALSSKKLGPSPRDTNTRTTFAPVTRGSLLCRIFWSDVRTGR